MLKLVILGIWVIAVTAAATFGSTLFQSEFPDVTGAESENSGTEEIRTEMTSVPMIRNGEITGYVIIQLSFQADRTKLEHLGFEPAPYLIDAAFRVIFSSSDMDFTRLRGSDLNRLTDSIMNEANVRIGDRLVSDVLIAQLNFVRKDDIRTNWIKNGDRG